MGNIEPNQGSYIMRNWKATPFVIPGDEFGDATPADVDYGKTFTSASGLKVAGTRLPYIPPPLADLLPDMTDSAGENDVREGKEYIDANGNKQYGRLKMDGVWTPDWSTYVPIEVQYDSDDRFLVMKNLDGVGGGGLETVTADISVYTGNSVSMYYMSPDGLQWVESPMGQFEVVKNSPVVIIYDGSTSLTNQGGAGYIQHYDNAWQYTGHSCAVLSFFEDGSVIYAEN
jgi:hypothetical protein